MKTITLVSNRTNEHYEEIGTYKVKKVILSQYYDLDGNIIDEGTKTWKNAEVKVQKHSWKEFGKKWNFIEVFVNGKEIEAEITSIQGNSNLMRLEGCIGCG